MRGDLAGGEVTREDLRDLSGEYWAAKYDTSLSTANRARKIVRDA
jgi:hypothetical protein